MDLAEQVDPEEWHKILDRFFTILADGVHRFEGTVNQYTGDGIMALFGAPIAHEDHARRACYAALHLKEQLRRYAEDLKRTRGLSFSVRMELNSGEVVVGKIGDDLRMDYTAQGHTVGLAARMEQLAAPSEVYVSEHCAKLVSGFFRLRDLGPFELKGVSAPVRIYELEGVGAFQSPLEVSRSRGFSRFVGRADEMASLEAALGHAVAGSGQVIGVIAHPGLGKSRLCFEFAERCRARGLLASAEDFCAVNIECREVGPRAAASVLVLDSRGLSGARRRGRMFTEASLDAGLLVGADDELVGFQGLALPLAGVEIKDAPRLDGEVRIAREDPGAVLPRANGIFVEPAPHRLVADRGHNAAALRLANDVGRAQT
jgi:class 3 adenylate cyclase